MPQKRETFLIEIQNYFECDPFYKHFISSYHLIREFEFISNLSQTKTMSYLLVKSLI
jgi:hypothetical protein